MSLRYRVIAVVLIVLMTFQCLGQIISHTYTVAIAIFTLAQLQKELYVVLDRVVNYTLYIIADKHFIYLKSLNPFRV